MKPVKKTLALLLALVMVFALAACSQKADEPKESAPAGDENEQKEAAVFEKDGYKLTVPAEYADLVVVDTEAEDLLFSVSEKASLEADDTEGSGWLFGVSVVDEARLHEMLTADMSGADVFARDGEGNYYIFCHPTDVRIAREGEITEADSEQWAALCEWAAGMKETFAAENGLETYVRTNTDLDIYLSRVAYLDDVQYTISTTQFGPKEPGDVDKTPFVEKLLNNVTFESTDQEAPDGEYTVLALKDGDMDVRIDFFSADGNLIRVVTSFADGEETITNESLYTAHYADGTTVAGDVMQAWYDALVAANG